MGIQAISCPASGLYMAGIMQIFGMIKKRKYIIDNFFDDFTDDFTDAASTKSGWDTIRACFQPYCMAKLVPIGATPSKPLRQGDGTINPFNVPKQAVYIHGIWRTCVTKKAFKTTDIENLYEFDVYPNTQIGIVEQQEALLRWGPVLTAYEIIYEIENNIALTIEAIKPLYRKASIFYKTPSQLYFYADEFFNGHLMKGAGKLSEFPWDLIDASFPDLVETINNGHVSDIWYHPVPAVTFGEDTFSGIVDLKSSTAFAAKIISGDGLVDTHKRIIKYDGDGETPMIISYYTMEVAYE